LVGPSRIEHLVSGAIPGLGGDVPQHFLEVEEPADAEIEDHVHQDPLADIVQRPPLRNRQIQFSAAPFNVVGEQEHRLIGSDAEVFKIPPDADRQAPGGAFVDRRL
jgi:hypothetical protein